ncbi:LDAP Interacting Protein [Hibiscus trionum]|uniref:LDAP Interacting Protein n=1 Tax=Hibiscus trionum TaxID=183268 RepID=A0A9W7HHG0_HIBTR|nr:LDAP Interacting Protein [Hibiscus trionum]
MPDQMNGVTTDENQWNRTEETLYDVLHRSISMIIFPNGSSPESTPLLQRIKISVSENGCRLREASRNTGRDVLLWTRRGSPLRALLVISIGTVALLTLTGLLIFMFLFLLATANAIIVSLLISLAAAGGFLFFSFACVTAIYLGALSIAAFVISAATISAIFAAMVAAGWVGFFWVIWLGTKKSMSFAKQSLSMTGSSAQHAHRD